MPLKIVIFGYLIKFVLFPRFNLFPSYEITVIALNVLPQDIRVSEQRPNSFSFVRRIMCYLLNIFQVHKHSCLTT